ncbi:Card1-like endonuclease domain-containing protein [Mariprofundus erugo]|uniref:Card1-like endonuclease domain-containing protein n=1 Tax=Mariprofundus erugo TaxID=2528639 RepID=UPI001375C554|nr:DUF1887 family CARF protein [Mariprofundus erugo]
MIQNVSRSAIPNLVAIRTFKPSKVIWVCPEDAKQYCERLYQWAKAEVPQQEVWAVETSNPKKLSSQLLAKFSGLDSEGQYVYHLSSGPKVLTSIGMSAFLLNFDQKHGEVIVYDEPNQSFDVLYPTERDDQYPSELVSLEEMLKAHGNSYDRNRPMRSTHTCQKRLPHVEQLKALSPDVKRAMKGKVLNGLHAPDSTHREFSLVSKKSGKTIHEFPEPLIRAFRIVGEIGLLKNLTIGSSGHLSFSAQDNNVYGYINGGWLEDWVGGVLADLEWSGAGVGVQVLMDAALSNNDSQEIDFLGARNNKLVYLSCKHTAKLTSDELFELDSLRDDLCGDGNFTIGIVHAGAIGLGMMDKAKRLNINVINPWAKNAAQELKRIIS